MKVPDSKLPLVSNWACTHVAAPTSAVASMPYNPTLRTFMMILSIEFFCREYESGHENTPEARASITNAGAWVLNQHSIVRAVRVLRQRARPEPCNRHDLGSLLPALRAIASAARALL